MRNGEHGICPDDMTLLAFVGRRLSAEESVDVVLHARECSLCRERIVDYAEWSPENFAVASGEIDASELARGRAFVVRQKEMRQFWRAFENLLTPSCEHLAAAGGQTDDQLQEKFAVKSGFLHFQSVVDKSHRDYWHVEMAIPVEVTEKSRIRMRVFVNGPEGDECPLEEGVLTFCGVELPIKNGRASMSIAEFRRSRQLSMISLSKDANHNVLGAPVLGFGLRT